MQQPELRHWALLLYLSLAWGLAFYLIALGLEGFPPLTLVNLRLLIGALTLFLVMRWQGLALPREGRWWWRFGLLSLCGNLVPFTLISWAETRISSGQAGLLMALMPISILLLAHFFVAHETLTPRRLCGVVLGFAGVAVLIGGDALRGLASGGSLLAEFGVLLATFSFAVNAVYSKRLPAINTLVVGTGALTAGSVLLLPFTLWLEQPWTLQPAPDTWLAVLALGVLATGIATWVYFVVVTDCGPNFLSIINYVIPVVAFAAGALLLAEPVSALQLTGLLIISGGIALSQSRYRPPA